MKAVIVTNNLIPVFSGNGSSVYLWSFCRGLVKKKIEVHLVTYNFNLEKWISYCNCTSLSELKLQLLESQIYIHFSKELSIPSMSGIKNSYLGRAIFPRTEHYYQGFNHKIWVNNKLENINPDIIFPYMVDAISAIQLYQESHHKKCVALITDMDHEVRKYRRIYSSNKSILTKIKYLRNNIAERDLPNTSISLLKQCSKICCSAHHHVDWLIQNGIKNVKYFPVPVLDRPGNDWKVKQELVMGNIVIPRILLLGNVNGIATLSGLYYLRNHLLVGLNKINKKINFEVRIVGGGELDKKIKDNFDNYNWIKRIGFVENIQDEFFSSSIILVPTPIPLGFRTRIAEAFSYGACVIAHYNNSFGMPELINNYNIVLAKNIKEFTSAIENCLSDKKYRDLIRMNARSTYIQKYEGENTVKKMIEFSFNN